MPLESRFQSELIKDIRELLPGCIILKNDANYLQGFADIIVLYGRYWGVLEAKREEDSSVQPNQEYYIDYANDMSYGSFVYPENKETVLNELQQALRPSRSARLFRRK